MSLFSESAVLKREGKVRLIGVGICKGTKARYAKEGDSIVWNYGSSSKIKAIRKASPTFLEFSLVGRYGMIYKRRFKPDRLLVLKKR